MLDQHGEVTRRHGLIPKASKTFRDQTEFDAIGASIDGVIGLVGAKTELLVQVLVLVSLMARTGVATLEAATTCVALQGYACLFRRDA